MKQQNLKENSKTGLRFCSRAWTHLHSYFMSKNFISKWILFPSLWMQPPKPVDFISRLHGFYDIISKPCGFYNQTRWICFYTCFVFLPVSSFLFKPLQVKEFLRGQLQILDITMLTVFRAHLQRNCWNLLLLKTHSNHGAQYSHYQWYQCSEWYQP